MDQFNQSRLNNLIGSNLTDGDPLNQIQIVLVQTCFSDSIGKIFTSAKVPVVIAVNQDSIFQDEASIMFIRHFYMQLIKGKTVEKSFIEAQCTVRASK